MKWLFRFNVEGQSQTGNKDLVQGFGHAMRCISLAQTFQQRYAGDALFLIQGNKDLGNRIGGYGL